METIDRAGVISLMDEGSPVIDVLPRREHEELRIAGSVGVWLREMDAEAVARFSKDDPVVVYCHDPL